MCLVVLLMSPTGSSLMLNFVTRINNCSFIKNSDNYEKMQAIRRSEKVLKKSNFKFLRSNNCQNLVVIILGIFMYIIGNK